MEEYIVESFVSSTEEVMYKLVVVDERGNGKTLGILDAIQLEDLKFNIETTLRYGNQN